MSECYPSVGGYLTGNTILGIIFQPQLSVHPDATADIRAMIAHGGKAEKAGYRIVALLEQAKTDRAIIDSLLDHDFGAEHSEPYHVSKWLTFWNQGFDLWRLKIWEDPKGSLPYRIIYAYDSSRLRYHVLGIVPRDFEYDPHHPLTLRIISAYRDLALAEYGRGRRRRPSV